MQSRLQIHKEAFSFSAGHFTIFSRTEREGLHGHNYYVSVTFDFALQDNGLSFDYRYYKRLIKSLCASLDRKFLLPRHSPYMLIREEKDYYYAAFNGKDIPFLHEDVVILPLVNITLEELSRWFLEALVQDTQTLKQHAIHSITVAVYNGLEQSASAAWA